jgi:hypothetical protein
MSVCTLALPQTPLISERLNVAVTLLAGFMVTLQISPLKNCSDVTPVDLRRLWKLASIDNDKHCYLL